MKVYVVLLSAFLLFNSCEANSKKKSIASLPWPGFPFARPPPGYFPYQPEGKPTEPDYYEDYDLVEGGEIDQNTKPDTKADYKKTNAFNAEISSAIHDFTFDLYTEMMRNKTDVESVLISPLSVYTALCMLTLGLGGNSRAQSMSVLHGDAFANMHNDMSELSDSIFDKKRADITLTKANRIFIDRSIRLLKGFKTSMKRDYHVTAKKVNFARAPELNRRRVNTFVFKNTEKKVKDLAPRGSITTDTRLFIVNAMYMKASWKAAFTHTMEADFLISPEESVKVDMMQAGSTNCFSEHNNELRANVVRIEMKGSVSMILIVPNKAGDFSTIEDGRGKERMRRALEQLYDPSYARWPQMCRITMPKFKIDYKADDLIEVLKNMGITDIFDAGRADLSEMTPSREPLFVSDMRHKATIDVNEKGIEAAAATSIGISARMMPQYVDIKQPFLFIVRDDIRGAPLFMGKVVRPRYE